MSEGSSRSSQEGLDGDSRQQQATLQRSQTTPSAPQHRAHPPVTRVCTSPHAKTGRPPLQPDASPSATQGAQQASAHGINLISKSQGGSNATDGGPAAPNDARSPPPYDSHHRLASSAQLASDQRLRQEGRHGAGQSNSASATEAPMVSRSPGWQDWQRDRWQIWQLLSSDNADALPETLV